jgi:predicted metal-dependent hydrolase
MTQQLGLFDRAATALDAPLEIRRSRRARRLILRVVPPHTLELVVPFGARPADVSSFVARHRRWIDDARREIAMRLPRDPERLPVRVELAAVGKSWPVRYRSAEHARQRCQVSDGALEVRSRDGRPETAVRQLRDWLLGQARSQLKPWLLREGAALGLQPSHVQLRLQRTRWGSCSSSGTVSLNAALLFVDPTLVRYLFVHELCHLVALSHSERFWAAVARVEPNYRLLDRRLSEAWAEIPLWVYER